MLKKFVYMSLICLLPTLMLAAEPSQMTQEELQEGEKSPLL